MKFPKVERREASDFKKPKFLRIHEGELLIRILGPKIYDIKTHWVNGVTIKCLDEECPICKNNERLRMEHPDNFRDMSGYIPWRTVFFTNVYDRTPVKFCPECGAEVQAKRGKFPAQCWNCETYVADAEVVPSNTVKILTRGIQLRDELEAVNNSIVDKEGIPIGIENYDVILRVPSSKEPVPIELPENNDVLEIPEDDLFALELVPIRLEPFEIEDLLRGVSLKDIFTARNAEKEAENSEEESVEERPEGVSKKARRRVESIFKH